MSTRKLKITGAKQIQTVDEELSFLTPKGSFEINSTRGETDVHEIQLEDEDRIELQFDDDTIWFGNANTLNEVFPDMKNKKRGDDSFSLPTNLQSSDDQRGIGSIALKLFSVFGKNKVQKSVAEIARKHEKKSLDNQSGLYEINANMILTPYKKADSDGPFLLFLHGTFSSTLGSFGDLKDSETWQFICDHYHTNNKNRILGFQHETLTKSPLQNVLDLITELPDNCNLHLVSHSRGGLVGDTLAYFAENKKGFTNDLIEIFEKENRKEDIKNIEAIVKIMATKKITIEKFIRVACPAFGTSLLSNGVDHFFNVALNIASVASGGNSIVVGCKELINAVIDSKNDVSVLPGLEAMNPNSTFLNILNSKIHPESELESPLSVIAGNSALSVNFKALKTLLLRIVFQSDNDLVVNTLSMYQGARRKNNIQYFFDEGTEVMHTSYFKNEKSRKALGSALKSINIQIAGFREYPIEKLDISERGVFGLEGGSVFKNNVSGKRPILFLLPGIMGSNLEKNNHGVWINYFRMLAGGLTELKISEPNVKATSLIKTSYKELCDFLSDSYDVVTVPYDWRKSMKEAGNQFNQLVESLLHHKQPMKIVAHSMGGLVARELMLHHEATWNVLNNQVGFKMLLLGTPWLGSFRIPSVLSGNDGIIKMISKLDLKHNQDELVELFSKFPGILALLPIYGHSAYDFSKESTWKTFQQATGLKWKIPDSKTIEDFGAFQKAVLDSIKTHKSEMYNNVIYVAGKDDSTPVDYTIQQDKLQIEYTAEGDQSVTWASGIPQKIDKLKSLYYVNVTHGALSCDETLFEGISELLKFGTTNLFSRNSDNLPKKSRGVQVIEQDIFEVNEEAVYRNLLGLPVKKRKTSPQMPAIKMSVSKGDLQFSKYPILIGHFYKDGIISAEKAADRNLGYLLSQKHTLGIYPGAIGSHLVEMGNGNGFKGALIVGLGQQEDLTVKNLSTTIEKAMMTYMVDNCQRTEENDQEIFGITSLLIGSFYGGLPILNSIRAIVSGVANANKKIDTQFGNKIKTIEHIEFVELYEDRALQCFNTINKMIVAENEDLQIEWLNRKIKSLPGSRKRITDENITDWWHRITIKSDENYKHEDERKLLFSSSTDAARVENKDLYTNVNLLESIIEEISENENWSPEKSITMFELLIPNNFKHNLHSQHNIALIVDKYAASFPWELMQTSLDSPSPLCIGAKMVRQLATYNTSEVINPSKDNRALIIGDPNLDGFTGASQLAGAQKEASVVFEKIKATQNFELGNALINKKQDEIIVALMKTDYKIIHLAGHGIFDAENPNQSGMLIGKQKGKNKPVFLTTKEITQMSSTPELVFVNCCYLGKMNEDAEAMTRDRYKLAANIGTQLIENGVKAVVVAGWAVDDAAALKFAEIFYDNILQGVNFGDSVFEARKATYRNHPYTNTWGAYQCYGDPFYSLTKSQKNSEWIPTYTVSQEAENDLDNLMSEAELPRSDFAWLETKLDIISRSIEASNLSNAETLEKEAFAYLELNLYKTAIEKFHSLLNLEKAHYTITAIERYNNLLTKQAYLNQKAEPNAKTIKDFDEIISNLKMLLAISETPERFSIIGSAFKRKAAVQILNNQPQHAIEKSLLESISYYKKAFAKETKNKMYSFCNWIELESILETYGTIDRNKKTYQFLKKEEILNTFKEHQKLSDNPDYWNYLQIANIDLCLSFLNEKQDAKIQESYLKVWKIIGSNNKKQTEIEHVDLLLDFCNYFYNDRMFDIVSKIKLDLLKHLA